MNCSWIDELFDFLQEQDAERRTELSDETLVAIEEDRRFDEEFPEICFGKPARKDVS